MKEHIFIKDIFENYGYIDLDTVNSNDKTFRGWLKKNYITVAKTGFGAGGWDEYRYTGTHSSLLNMLEKHFDEDLDFLDEFFVKL